MSSSASREQRRAFYRAALQTLRTLDTAESTPRRFGPAADARWEGFCGHLGTAERIDLLIRDAAVTWGTGFSAALVFSLPGLASDEPFGPDWEALPEPQAKRLWGEVIAPGTVGAVADGLGVERGDVALPAITASTRLIVTGGAAIVAAGERFAGHRELSWSDQVLVVADSAAACQLAGLVAPLILASGPTVVVRPSEDVAGTLQGAGFASGGEPVMSDDATGRAREFVRQATRGR